MLGLSSVMLKCIVLLISIEAGLSKTASAIKIPLTVKKHLKDAIEQRVVVLRQAPQDKNNRAGLIIPPSGSGSIGSIIPEIPGIEMACNSTGNPGNYPDYMKCADGTAPDLLEIYLLSINSTRKGFSKSDNESIEQYEDEIEKRRKPWFHPANEEHLKTVEDNAEACSPACKSKMCFYSFHVFEYVCGTFWETGFKDTKRAIQRLRQKWLEYKQIGEGKYCMEPAEGNSTLFKIKLGMDYDPRHIDLADTATAAYYVDQFKDGKQIEKWEKEINSQKICKKVDSCEFVPERASFICGGRGTVLGPIKLFNLIILDVTLVLIRMFNNISV